MSKSRVDTFWRAHIPGLLPGATRCSGSAGARVQLREPDDNASFIGFDKTIMPGFAPVLHIGESTSSAKRGLSDKPGHSVFLLDHLKPDGNFMSGVAENGNETTLNDITI